MFVADVEWGCIGTVDEAGSCGIVGLVGRNVAVVGFVGAEEAGLLLGNPRETGFLALGAARHQARGKMTKSARVTIRTVRFKSGGEVRLLRQPVVDPVRASAERSLRTMMDAHSDTRPAGYAMVVWDTEGGSQAAFWSGPGPTWPVATALIPDYARARLLLAIASQWVNEDIREALGYPPDGAS